MDYKRLVVASVLLLFVALVALRVRQYVTFAPVYREMPMAVAEADERLLFQTPRGLYSLADIAANGPQLPSERYRGFRARHDYDPRPGDKLCPITRTKANSECTWIVNSQKFEFCCPPCIAEFVRDAQETPESILPAEEYVAKTP